MQPVSSRYTDYAPAHSRKIKLNWYGGGGGVQLGPLGTATTNGPIVSAPGNWWNGDWQGTRSTRRKRGPVPLCPPQTPHAARKRTRAAAVGSQ
jgi:hypothetical protein